jgi:poly(A) polymerase
VELAILERSEHPVSRRDIDANVLKVLYRLINAGHIAYLVGGGVRDLMLGRHPKDFDVATSAHPHQVRELFRNSRLIGRRFRLVHVFFRAQNIEVATFRRHSEDVADLDDPLIRHDNTFGTPEEDAFRRDFTVNALFYDPRTFRVIDFVGGVPDLRSRLIRSVGDPEVRMREDPVRMVRAVRFAAKLGFEIEPATRAAIERHNRDLAKASVPRRVEETFRTLAVPDAARALVLMEQLGLLSHLLPSVSQHLKLDENVKAARTVRNLAVFGDAIVQRPELPRPLILASLFADLHLTPPDGASSMRGANLVKALREQGFSRADTELMWLLLEALRHMISPSRITRRLVRRPYFADARQLFESIAPAYGVDVAALDRFLATPRDNKPAHHRTPALATAEGGESAPGRSRHRRHRRRGRRRLDQRPEPVAVGEETLSASTITAEVRAIAPAGAEHGGEAVPREPLRIRDR